MKRAAAFISILLIVFVICLDGAAQGGTDPEKLALSNAGFAVDLHRTLSTRAGNILFSPYSISTAAGLAYAGARGHTAKQIADVFRFPLLGDRLARAFASLRDGLTAAGPGAGVELRTASSLWLQEKYPFLGEYLDTAAIYDSEIIAVDYINNAGSAKNRINAWVEEKTSGRIRGIIRRTPEPSTRLFLTNAVYFKGRWASRFTASATAAAPFRCAPRRIVQVPMMNVTDRISYTEDDAVQVVELPYTGRALSMVIVLPRKDDGIGPLEKTLTAEGLRAWRDGVHPRQVEVFLPRVKTTLEIDLKDILRGMGVTDAFAPGRADFSGIDGRPNWLYIGSAVHKAFIEVNEEGTEAAAATVAGGCFPAGTAVLTANGLRGIESVTAGTRVYARDFTTGSWVLAAVRGRQSLQYQGDMILIRAGGVSIEATGNHPFLVVKGKELEGLPAPADVPAGDPAGEHGARWVEARRLRAGDELLSRNNGRLTVTETVARQASLEVYNLDVEGSHTYCVHECGIVVHNKASAESFPVKFRADHPYLFFIRENKTGSILFMGRISDPSAE